MKKYLILSVFPFLMQGCTNLEEIKKEESKLDKVLASEVITLKGNNKIRVAVVLNPKNNEKGKEYLHIVEPSDSNKAVIAKTGAFVLGLLTGKASVTGFDRSDLIGSPVQLENIHKTYSFEKYKDFLIKNLILNVENQDLTNYPIKLYPEDFRLIYGDKDDYVLYSEFTVEPTLAKNEDSYSHIDSFFYCFGQKDSKPLTQWKANNYSLVTEISKQYIDRCFSDEYSKFQQKHLLKLKSNLENR